MACGLPAIAANASGTRELVIDGQTGYLFKVDDVGSLRQSLARALGPSASELGVAARTYVEEHYAIESLATEYERLYANLLLRDD
jgi:glycosyltransferase involved in cell wall biosynthesis